MSNSEHELEVERGREAARWGLDVDESIHASEAFRAGYRKELEDSLLRALSYPEYLEEIARAMPLPTR